MSSPYELLDGNNPEKYPNSDFPGVYIFIIVGKDVLNIGKSKNKVGAQLQRDVRKWVISKHCARGERVVLVTVPTRTIQSSEGHEVPLMLERHLKDKFPPLKP